MAKSGNSSYNIYEDVTRRIVMSLAQGVIPWRKRWASPTNEAAFYNYSTGRPYTGVINRLLLGTPGAFMTFKQAQAEGGHIVKGAKARIVIFFDPDYVPAKDKAEADRLKAAGEPWDHLKRPRYFAHNVFSIDDIEGLKPKEQPAEHKEAENPTDIANFVLTDYKDRTGVTIEEKISDCFLYDASTDTVKIPSRQQFPTEEQWYNTAFNGLVKSTAKEDRCNRAAAVKDNLKNIESIKEELVSEIGAAMVLAGVELENIESEQDTKAECAKWMEALNKDFRLIVFAAAQAEKAAKYILKPLL